MAIINFFCAFLKILTKTTFEHLLFLKLKQKENMKKYCFKVFVPKLKNLLFWGSNNFFSAFFSAFSKITTKRQRDICASIVIKAESKPNHEENIFCVGFSSKTKNVLFRESKMVLFKTQILNLFFCVFFFNVMSIFRKIY